MKIPEYLDEKEQDLLLAQTKKNGTVLQRRNHVIIDLILKTGLRCSECLDIKRKDIDWVDGKIKVVQGKGGKDRILWVGESTLKSIADYLEIMDEYLLKKGVTPGCSNVFLTSKGWSIDSSYLRSTFARYGKQAGIEKRVHPHMLRHTFATYFYRKHKDLRMLQKALGHENLSCVQIYTHIIDEEFEQSMKDYEVKDKDDEVTHQMKGKKSYVTRKILFKKP